MKLSRRLYAARQKLCIDKNLKRIAIGGRIPNYHKYADKLTAVQYVQKVIDKKIYDPVLTAQLANGFVLRRLLPNYLPNDKESLGYATFLEWINFNYKAGALEMKTSPYVRVCAVQYQMRMISSFDEFAQNCEYFIDAASDYRCDIVLFPEMFTMQLLTFMPNKSPGNAIRSLHGFTTRYEELFTNLSIKYNINIIAGSHLVVENDDLYNVSYLFRRDGTFAKQYKIHISPHERKWWGVKPGHKVQVFDTDIGKIAILICYDVEFPELARIAVSKGAQILFVPFNTDERRGYLRVRYCSQARAIENQVYMVLAGCVGNLPAVENLDIQYAQSAIFTPSDVEFHMEGIAMEASANTETLIFQDLDLNLLARNREYGSVQTWKDRRTDLYKINFTEDNKKLNV
jgi:predicted amidohydrolase